METHRELLSTADEIRVLADELKKHEIIAFDTEFIRESTFYPIVEIIQVATDSDSWLVDAQAFKKKFRSGPPSLQGTYDNGIDPLLEVFRDQKILKIAHAVQGDQECLYTSFGVIAEPVLDTAVAASLCGLGDAVGLGKLLKSALNVTIKKGHARTNWSVRPLPDQLMEYAHADVEYLVELGRKLMGQLDKLGRKEWTLNLSAKWSDPSIYELDVDGITQKLARSGKLDKRGYGALREMVLWRETRVRQLNLPRRWVADDNVLVDLATVRPKTLDHLASFRGLNKGELKASGDQIIASLNNASEGEEISLPKYQRPDIPSPEESQVLDLLKCYVGILADQHRIAAKHLMTTAQLLPLLRARMDLPEDLVKAGVLSADAAGLIGAELIAFMKGERSLSVVNGTKIQITEISK